VEAVRHKPLVATAFSALLHLLVAVVALVLHSSLEATAVQVVVEAATRVVLAALAPRIKGTREEMVNLMVPTRSAAAVVAALVQ
jgi:hypothetical protein